MKKYAMIVTSSGYIPGCNSQINSLKYYKNDSIEYHFLYVENKLTKQFLESISKNLKHFNNFIPINLRELINESWFIKGDKISIPWLCKMARYQYAANVLKDYDAVVIYDADALLVNNIENYFFIADKTEKILLPNNDYSNAEYDSVRYDSPYLGGASPPLHCFPLFIKPSKYYDLLMQVTKNNLEGLGSDMCSLNNALISMDLLKEVIPLAGSRWVFSNYYGIKLRTRNINDKKYISFLAGGDRMFSVHRKWWDGGVCKKYIMGPKNKEIREMAFNNIKIFWEFYKFLNTELWNKLEWNDKWLFPNLEIGDI